MTRLRGLRVQFTYLGRAIRLIFATSRWWAIAWLGLLLIQGLLPAATVFLTRQLIDRSVVAIRMAGAWEGIQPVLIPAALMAAVMVLTEVVQSGIDWTRTVQAELLYDHTTDLVHRTSAAADMAFYESPEYFDHLHRARSDASPRLLALLEGGGGLFQNGVTLIAMAGILIPYGLWLPLILVLSTLPALGSVLHFNRRFHQWWKASTGDRRRTDYFDSMLTGASAAAELRLFDLGGHFQGEYARLRQRLRTVYLRMTLRQSLTRLGAGITALVLAGLPMAWMLLRALQGLATLGDLALFYQAFNRGQTLMRVLLGNVGTIYTNSLFLGSLFEFLDLEPRVVDPPNPLPAPGVLLEGIAFRGVTFRYPKSERAALENFDLVVPAGQIVAIVGANGSGKSTLLKLLCRLYDPDCGSIELDGNDIRALALRDLRSLITVLFQAPVAYHTTAAQNIALGVFPVTPDDQAIQAAAVAAGAHEVIERLPRGYATHLGKWFADGVDLSGGEWQRVALARAFLRQAQIILLDEPTSAIDAWAEADWFERFRTLAKGRTALLITHRFTIARRADIIHVMDAGRIVESGRHEELLARGGLYAAGWSSQLHADAVSEHVAGDTDVHTPVLP